MNALEIGLQYPPTLITALDWMLTIVPPGRRIKRSGHSFWGVWDVPRSVLVRASRKCVWRCLWPFFGQTFGRFSAKLLAAFRPNFWTFFGKKFGQFSSKTLSAFRPKNRPAHQPRRASENSHLARRSRSPDFTGGLPKFHGNASQICARSYFFFPEN